MPAGAHILPAFFFQTGMEIVTCSMDDFSEIRAEIAAFWGSDRTLYLHHPMLVYEFGNTAFVIRDNGKVAAYLFGFFSQTESVAYVHLVGVRDGYKRQGLGKRLYDHFMALASTQKVQRLKAITSTDNTGSITFHTQQMGMTAVVVKNYSGPGMDRVVFEKEIAGFAS